MVSLPRLSFQSYGFIYTIFQNKEVFILPWDAHKYS